MDSSEFFKDTKESKKARRQWMADLIVQEVEK